MSRTNVEALHRSNAAFAEGDVAGALKAYAADVEWRDLQHAPDTPEVVRGIEAVKRIMSDWVDSFSDLRVDIVETVEVGDAVICVLDWHAVGTESGLVIDQRTAEVFEFRNGQIVRATYGYRSKDEALAAVGASP